MPRNTSSSVDASGRRRRPLPIALPQASKRGTRRSSKSDGEAVERGGAGREPLAEGVARSLAEYIATSRLVAGDSLRSETELARMFRVSTRTIREALRILTEQGIVQTSQGRRATVSHWRPRAMKRSLQLARHMGSDRLSDLLELRFALEPRTAALAALRNEPADLEAIEAALRRMYEVGSAVEGWVDADVAFHDSIVRATHNAFFEMVMGALSESLHEERLVGLKGRLAQGRTQDQTLREHSAIVHAIRAKDAALAERRMLKHLEQSLTYFWGIPQSELFAIRASSSGRSVGIRQR